MNLYVHAIKALCTMRVKILIPFTRFGEPRKRRVNPYVSGGDIAPGPRPSAPIMHSGIHGD